MRRHPFKEVTTRTVVKPTDRCLGSEWLFRYSAQDCLGLAGDELTRLTEVASATTTVRGGHGGCRIHLEAVKKLADILKCFFTLRLLDDCVRNDETLVSARKHQDAKRRFAPLACFDKPAIG